MGGKGNHRRPKKLMKILYTGPFTRGSLTEARRQALCDLGQEVIELDQVPYLQCRWRFSQKAQQHLLIGNGVASYNRDLVNLAKGSKPDIVYIDQAVYLWAATVSELRRNAGLVVHYTSEYLGFRSYLYRHFFKAVHLYDTHVITNELNRPILEAKGARRILKTEFGYCPRLHHPPHLTEEDRRKYASEAVFIGHWEPETEQVIGALRQAGIAVRVWGPGWRRARSLCDRCDIQPLYGHEYVKALGAAKLGLCFLSKWNFNGSASRTFEIPSVGGFLLAERTPDHLSYFAERKEAEFFSSTEELIRKAQYYIRHERERQAIAAAGYRHCVGSGYTHERRMQQTLQDLR
jgi:spore maturation protein CgeB